MKTIIKFQETGNRNYKKVMIIVFALLIGLGLNNFTVISQNSFETGKLTNAMIHRNVELEQPYQDSAILASAYRSVIIPISPAAIEISSFRIEPMAEKRLEIEGWMTELNNFGQVANYAVDKEEPLELEEWMMNEMNFGNSAMDLTAETEPQIRVENWMINEVFWRR